MGARLCCHCARPLLDVLGRAVDPVVRTIEGIPMRLHGSCAKRLDAGKPYVERPRPAVPGTTRGGRDERS